MKKIIVIILSVLAILFLVAFLWLVTNHYDATENAMQDAANCVEESSYISCEKEGATTGFIFYPGAKVDPYSYAYLSEVNANVYIAKFPFEIAFLDIDVADEIIESNTQNTSYYIGGHSLGGVAASEYAKTSDDISGIIYLASYPADDMSEADMDTLAFFATNDGLVTDYEQKIELLPENATVVTIEGGNHAYMGDYGKQDKDNEASITIDKQHQIIIEEINKFISKE